MLRRIFIALGAASGMSFVASGHGFAQSNATPSARTRDLVISRLFDAPIGLVWNAWSDPEQVMRWWGPNGFTAPVAEIDFRVDATSLVCMRSPEGQTLCNTWTYQVIVPMERIEFIQHFADESGNTVTPAEIGLPAEIPPEVRHLITFDVVSDNETELTVTEFGYISDEILELSRAGMNECLDKMAATFLDA